MGRNEKPTEDTVSSEPPPDEAHVGSRPPLRVRSATDADLERLFGASEVLIGFPVRPEPKP